MARWIRTHPGMVASLVMPVIVFGLPLLFGSVFLAGDDLIQNFPLRVLVGQDLRHWVPPLWDPYISSGTPLLGGFNAGAAYPATWLFSFVPSGLAWTANLCLAYDGALLGMYLFLRRQPVSQSAATFGAASFAFAGYLSAQIVHIDLIEGASWIPWILVAVHSLTSPPTDSVSREEWRRRCRRSTILLAVGTGMTILAGGSEAFIDGGILAAIYLVYRVVGQGLLPRSSRSWSIRSMVSIALGVVIGAALSAAQILSGLAFVGHSQRSNGTYAFFTSGSLPPRTLALLVSPFLLGTNQSATGYYAGQYNFPEVTSYMGILALIAACSLLTARWRHRPERRTWEIWYLVMAVGVLAALGVHTPFGHLLYVIPGVNAQRLLNRNLLLVDFSLAVLLAWWVHLLLDRQHREADPGTGGTPGGFPPPVRSRSETVLVCAPAVLIGVACALLWTAGGPVLRALGGLYQLDSADRRSLALIATAELVIAVLATWVVLAERRLSVANLRRLLAAVLIVDLGFFGVWTLQPPVGTRLSVAQGHRASQLASDAGSGRFIIYDPDTFHDRALISLGQTDLNVIGHLPSAQGYAALIDNGYFMATGAHYQESLDPATLAGSVWNQLNAQVLLSLPSYFVTSASRAVPGIQSPAPLRGVDGSVPVAPSDQQVGPGRFRRWYFGGVLTVEHGSLPLSSAAGSHVRIGLITRSGRTRWLPSGAVRSPKTAGAATTFALPGPTPAAGLVVASTASSSSTRSSFTVGVPMVATSRGSVLLDGRLQGKVTSPHWEFIGSIGPFGAFRNTRAKGWAWATTTAKQARVPAGTTVTSRAPGLDGSQRVKVNALGPITVVRSEAWATGWHATLQPVNSSSGRPSGPVVAIPVRKFGIVQAVRITAPGSYVVDFVYRPGPAIVGIVLSAAAALALLVWALAEGVGSRRRRCDRGLPPRSRAEQADRIGSPTVGG